MYSELSTHIKPSLRGIIIPGKRGKIFSTLFYAGQGQRPTVLLFHGIPGNEQNEDIAKDLRTEGFHVITFHYSGCFGSDGDYSLSNNLEDANTVLDYILSDTYGLFDKNRIYAVGHSMGGFVCGNLAASRDEIKGAVLITPCDIGRIFKIEHENPSETERLEKILDESSSWLRSASREKFMSELRDKSESFRLENAAAGLSREPILCISASFDTHTPPIYHCTPLINKLRGLNADITETVFETDHFASDCRRELSVCVIDFLSRLSGESIQTER